VLQVVEPGLLTTVQGAGRPQAVALGVPLGGACDRWSLAMANALLGNATDAPALEMTLLGATFLARADCLVALAGADMAGRLDDGSALAPGASVLLRAGQVLAFGSAAEGSGTRAYLALAGGVDVPEVLGSPSTCLVGGFGGHEGRALVAGDTVRPREPRAGPPARLVGVSRPVGRVRVVRGPHVDQLPASALAGLLGGLFTVGRGDRQGVRLEGPSIAAGGSSLVSLPMRPGAVQLPPDGQPIILLVDHHTVGGYPVPAVVIGADLPRLGQLGPGDEVGFEEVSLADARQALLELDHEIASFTARVAGP
jgi:biotin-dependent carboxylase-like uncharacterized protein